MSASGSIDAPRRIATSCAFNRSARQEIDVYPPPPSTRVNRIVTGIEELPVHETGSAEDPTVTTWLMSGEVIVICAGIVSALEKLSASTPPAAPGHAAE